MNCRRGCFNLNISNLNGVIKSVVSKKLPVVLSSKEIKEIFSCMEGVKQKYIEFFDILIVNIRELTNIFYFKID